MSRIKHPQILKVFLALAMLSDLASAQQVIAHRGAFHNTTGSIPENTFTAVAVARTLGLPGVEVDLRTAQDGIIMVTHDQISNRTTTYDNADGKLNPALVAAGQQTAVSPIHISDHPSSLWNGTELKAYGPYGALISNKNFQMQTLSQFLTSLKDDGVLGNGFKVILDIQDPYIFAHAASIVSGLGVQSDVYLKFFVKSAIYNNQTYDGANSCYEYMQNNNLKDSHLKIIPQINDGELDAIEDDNSGIKLWGATLTIPEYLDCWSNAIAQHPGSVATMPIVSASVPADNDNATQAATAAINWARSNGRQTMSVVPNPDVCYGTTSRSGVYNPFDYSFSSTNVRANSFNFAAQSAKQNFVNSVHPDYVIVDIYGFGTSSWSAGGNDYLNALCTNKTP